MTQQNKVRTIEVVKPNPRWKYEYREESEKVLSIMGDEIAEIHHIGSTSISGIYAKPIIDILIGVKNILEVDKYDKEMVNIGYTPKGEYGIEGRRFYLKGEINRTHHIHIFEIDSPHIKRHLNFRDYMNTHPKDAKRYEELKKDLANEFRYDNEAYCDGKDDFIKKIDKKAEEWDKERQN